MNLNIGLMFYPVYTLGPGVRLGIWLAGCTLACPGCMTPEFWEARPEHRRSLEDIAAFLDRLPEDVHAVTISGGEPFQQPEGLAALLHLLRARGYDDIWVYTGYTLEWLRRRYASLLSRIDVLIDGPYRQDLPTDLLWRGSANQRMHLLSPRARRRHARWVQARGHRPHLQVVALPRGVRVIGIPRAGEGPWAGPERSSGGCAC